MIPSLCIAMSMFQYAVVLLLLFVIVPRNEDAGPTQWLPSGASASIILAWSLAPQSIISSLDLQIDGTVGVIMIGSLGVTQTRLGRNQTGPVMIPGWASNLLTERHANQIE